MGQYVLVLNAGYEYLNIASLHRAIKLVYKGKAEILKNRDSRMLRAASCEWAEPSIIKMRYYVVKPYMEAPLTRKNVLIRDRYICQYCGEPGGTVDHIQPVSRGGKTAWENCVCACNRCNSIKKDRTPAEARMKLLTLPRRPLSLLRGLTEIGGEGREWEKYIYMQID